MQNIDIPPIAKTAGKTILAILTAVGVYKIYKAYQNYQSTAEERTDQAALIKKGEKLSYPLTTYKGFVDTIVGATYQFFDDEQSIYNVFRKLNNTLDVIELIKQFGTQRALYTFTNYNLPGFLSNTLDTSEIEKINQILSSKNINYRF